MLVCRVANHRDIPGIPQMTRGSSYIHCLYDMSAISMVKTLKNPDSANSVLQIFAFSLTFYLAFNR